VEKTVLDLQGLGFATDLGVALQRTPGAGHALGWHLMLANDSGQKPENNASKKLSLSVPWRAGHFVFEGMGDFTGEAGPRDRWTTRLFGGWQHGRDAAGVEVFQRVNAAAGVAGADVRPTGASAWARRALGPHWRAAGRLDWFDPDRSSRWQGYREWYLVAALDVTPQPSVHFIPNLLLRAYSPKSSTLPRRDPDLTLRVTLDFTFR